MFFSEKDVNLKEYCCLWCDLLGTYVLLNAIEDKKKGRTKLTDSFRNHIDKLKGLINEFNRKTSIDYQNFFVHHNGFWFGDDESCIHKHLEEAALRYELIEALKEKYPGIILIGSDDIDCINLSVSVCNLNELHDKACFAAIEIYADLLKSDDQTFDKNLANRILLSNKYANESAINMINSSDALYASIEANLLDSVADMDSRQHSSCLIGLLYLYCFMLIEVTAKQEKKSPVIGTFSDYCFSKEASNIYVLPLFMLNNMAEVFNVFRGLIEKCNKEHRNLIIHDIASLGTEYMNDLLIFLKPVFDRPFGEARRVVNLPDFSEMPSVIIPLKNDELQRMDFNPSVLDCLKVIRY